MYKNKYGRKCISIKSKDKTGEKYGSLLVKEMLYGYGKHGEGYAKCVCDCGNECIKSTYSLTHSRNPPHCGCMTSFYKDIQSDKSRKDLTGMRFGRLTVKRMVFEKGKHTRAVCECDCGNTIEVIATYLTSGDTTSCGCYKLERTSDANTKDFSGIVSDYGVEFLCRDHRNEKNQWMWKCKCGICGKEFIALPAKILNGHITSCGCAKSSSGERYVESVLNKLNVNYIREYKFSDCKNINSLPFDFYLPEDNTVIEYQGQQHYHVVSVFGGEEELSVRKRNDDIKRSYCKTNNIQLLELPYTMSNEEIKNKLQTLFIRRDCNG